MEPLISEQDFRKKGRKGWVFLALLLFPTILGAVNLCLNIGIISVAGSYRGIIDELKGDVSVTLENAESNISKIIERVDVAVEDIQSDIHDAMKSINFGDFSSLNETLSKALPIIDMITTIYNEVNKTENIIEGIKAEIEEWLNMNSH